MLEKKTRRSTFYPQSNLVFLVGFIYNEEDAGNWSESGEDTEQRVAGQEDCSLRT